MITLLPSVASAGLATSTNPGNSRSSSKPTTSTNPGNHHSSSKPATFPSANTSPSPSKSSTASINNVNQSSTTSSFTKPSASATTKKLQDLSQVKVTANNSMKVLKELLNLTAEIFAPDELNISLTIFEEVVKNDAISPGSKAESKRIGKIILNIAENLLNNSISSWGALKARGKTSSEIVLKVVEEAAGSLGKSLAVNDTISFNTSHFGLRIDNVDPVHFINQTIVFVGLKIEDKKSDQYFGNDEEAFIPAVLPEAIQGECSHS
ncbi:uncharacterized protein LOC114517140 [Dendronephthya gigantea]|uniref:uncharacterized protein LOC114517140 n=1 Tax=Dendronephthya gigantea TaxID=151771 RepID=UPI00106A431E|nr:uncharacterized protein LOC114517140 [Dendronephthya gigantea]